MGSRNYLNTGCNDTDFRWLKKCFLQPLPLGFSKDFSLVRFIRSIRAFSLFSFGRSFQRSAKISGIQKNELNAFPFRSNSLFIINAHSFTANGILGLAKEIEEELLRLDFLRVFDPSVIFAVVVVIPCPKETTACPQFAETWHRGKGIPFAL